MNPKSFGLALAIVSGGFWFLGMSLALLTGIGDGTMKGLGWFHPFFEYSWTGMLTITAEHLVAGFVLGYAIAWVYNKVSK